MVLGGQFHSTHNDIVGGVLPSLVGWVVDSVSPAREVQALGDLLGVGAQDVAPLERCDRPLHEVLVHVVVEALPEIPPPIIVLQFLMM